ncbi:YggT family protein [Litorimonas sp. RW-G-Af-16]|uniref:YggT family protein n=1 Tax=Litorimonas sp. RW-G-Af-16 TaxID=3241168 RepID=UPI00390C7684
MNLLQSILVYFVSPLISLLILIMFIYMVFSWLIAFNVVNLRNPMMAQIYGLVERIVEPILRPLRRVIPPMGGLDLAFLVAILGLYWIQGYLIPAAINLVG